MMQKQVEQMYRSKLENIEKKFKLISEAYSKLSLQIQQKNEIIQDLNKVIHILQTNLEHSNSKLQEAKVKIQKLQAKLEKQAVIKKVFMSSQVKIDSFVPQSPKAHQANILLSSQTSIVPKADVQKDFIQPQETKQIKSKHLHPIKSTLNDEKVGFLGEKRNKFEKTVENLQAEEIHLPKEINFDFNSSKLTDLTNLNINKANIDVKLKEISGLQTQKTTHQQIRSQKSITNKQSTMKTLTKIWEERDRQIEKMDELFQSINSKLKEFEQ